MNADPERLLTSGGADPAERELLASVRNVDAPDGAKERAWRAVAGQLAAGVAVGTSAVGATSATAHGGTLSLVPPFAFKAAGVLLVVGVVAGGTIVLRAPEPEAGPKLVVAPRAPSKPVIAPAREAEPSVEQAASAAVAVDDAPAKRSQESERTAALAAESALLTEARAKLRGGDVGGASEALARAQRRFPRGVLSQEREVLAIEILSARGNADAARSRARAFIAAYPSSPHSEKLRRLFGVP